MYDVFTNMDSLSISIITISLNSEKYLEQTIQSVINQTYKNKEYIIIDGGSTDSTLDIVKKYESEIDYWIAKPDNGIADAMNIGLKAAKGDFILFLHSDDYLLDKNSIEKATQFFENNHDIFLFNLYYSDNDNKTLANPRGLGWWINFKTGILHQSCICTRSLFDKIGNFDTSFKITMDYDFFLRAHRAGAKAKHIDIPLSVMRKTGISSRSDWPSLKHRFAEEKQVHKKNCPNTFLKLLYQVYWSGYLPYRYILHCLRQS